MKSWRSCRAVLRALVKDAARDRRGSVAVVIGFVMVALVGMLALAVDVSAAVSAHAQLRQAADTAALAAVRQAAIDTQSDANASLAAATAAGVQRFMAQAGAIPRVAPSQPVVTVSRSGLVITAVVTFNASYTTQIAGGLNAISSSYGAIASIPLGGSVAAQQTTGAYADIQVLMDTSNSMTITSTPNDAAALASLYRQYPLYERIWEPGQASWRSVWQPNCTVACHAVLKTNNNAPYDPHTNLVILGSAGDPLTPPPIPSSSVARADIDPYEMAKYYGISMRIDLLRIAVTSMATATAHTVDPSKYRFGFYTFDLSVVQRYALGSAGAITSEIIKTEVTPVRYNSDVTINTTPAQSNVGGSIAPALPGNPPNFTDFVTAAGDGTSQSSAKKYVVIITDGVEDYNIGTNRLTATFDPKSCNVLKAPVNQGGKAATVIVLHAASADNFVTQSNDLDPAAFAAAAAAMKACASNAAYYFLASSPADIVTATQQIISLTLAKPTVITVPPSSFQTSSTSTGAKSSD